MWLGCIGAVSGYCCKEVYDFLIILLISTPLVLALFCSSSIPTSLFIFKISFCSCIYYTDTLLTIINYTKRELPVYTINFLNLMDKNTA